MQQTIVQSVNETMHLDALPAIPGRRMMVVRQTLATCSMTFNSTSRAPR